MESGAGLWLFLGASAGSVPHRDLVVAECGVIPALLGGEHTQDTLCHDRELVCRAGL